MYVIISNDGDKWKCVDASAVGWLIEDLLNRCEKSGVQKEVSFTVEWYEDEQSNSGT